MKTIDLSKDIKTQFIKSGLVYPFKKSSGKFGLPKSSVADRDNEHASVQSTLNYLLGHNIIEVINADKWDFII